jgi:ribosomal-protein-alanine N-acetyltransferase
MTVRITPIEEEHLESVKTIEKNCFPKPWDDQVFQTLARWRGRLLLESGKIIRMDVAIEEKDTAGYVVWEENRMNLRGRIMNIAVRVSSRRKGYGRFLLLHSLNSQKANGMKICELEVRETNIPARRLYESIEMKVSGQEIGYYETEDAILYSIEF